MASVLLVGAALSSVACGAGTTPAAAMPVADGHVLPFPEDERAWHHVMLPRVHVELPLFDTHAWHVEDRAGAFVATHPSTSTEVTVWTDPGSNGSPLMNRQRCEARAVERGLVRLGPGAHAVDQTVTVGPGAYDTQIRVLVEARNEDGREAGPLVGHAFAFGAFVRKCLFVHVATAVPSPADEGVLSERLAAARVRILGGLVVPDIEAVPRVTPGAR